MTVIKCPSCNGTCLETKFQIKVDIPGFSGRIYTPACECADCGETFCNSKQKKLFLDILTKKLAGIG